jgi:hypothetical protein
MTCERCSCPGVATSTGNRSVTPLRYASSLGAGQPADLTQEQPREAPRDTALLPAMIGVRSAFCRGAPQTKHPPMAQPTAICHTPIGVEHTFDTVWCCVHPTCQPPQDGLLGLPPMEAYARIGR